MTRVTSVRSASVIGCSRPSPADRGDSGPALPRARPWCEITRRTSSSWSTVVISLRRGSKRNSWRRRASAGRPGRHPDRRPAASSSRATSVGSPAGAPPGPSRSALLHAAAIPGERGETPSGRRPLAGRRPRPGSPLSPGVQTAVTRIRFSVRVPVLSVQITRGGPEGLHRGQPFNERAAAGHLADAGGEGERDGRQQAFRDVGDEQPDREADGSGNAQPGGQADRQERDAGARRRPPAISQAARLTCCSSGLSLRSPRWLSEAMRPSSVPIPVAVTRASRIAAGARGAAEHHIRWPRSTGTSVSAGPADLVTGTDSPVSVDMSTSTVPLISRASAQMRSPSSMSRTSPGTSSRASMSCDAPSRSTRARARGGMRPAPPQPVRPAVPARRRTRRSGR